jgi:hypothetical protein
LVKQTWGLGVGTILEGTAPVLQLDSMSVECFQ